MIQYGLISETDWNVLKDTLDLIIDSLPDEQPEVYSTCIGIFNGDTDRAIHQYCLSRGCFNYHTAIDNQKDKLVEKPHQDSKLIIGDSSEVYNQIEDESQHLLFVDGCHCFAHVISDFFCYCDKVRVGGFIAFHDTGKHIQPFKDFQHGDKENPDAYISCRKALNSIGLYSENIAGWELVFDEADETNEAGGICVFKKLYK